ncbi:MAG: hypothetical protein P8P74_12775 [Crocinitomicaceae bacterium]|nr:hypothetical protein [Crocinitomicaceae bacterium]
MKRIIFGSALLILLIGVTSLAPSQKHKYKSKEAKLSVTFPAEFETSTETKSNYTSVKTQAIVDEMIFLLIHSEHESDVSDHEGLAEISLNAFMDGIGTTPTEKSKWLVKKNSGLKATFDVEDKDLVGDYRVILVGQIQYQITAVAPKSAWDEEKAMKFFKSFKVKK